MYDVGVSVIEFYFFLWFYDSLETWKEGVVAVL